MDCNEYAIIDEIYFAGVKRETVIVGDNVSVFVCPMLFAMTPEGFDTEN